MLLHREIAEERSLANEALDAVELERQTVDNWDSAVSRIDWGAHNNLAAAARSGDLKDGAKQLTIAGGKVVGAALVGKAGEKVVAGVWNGAVKVARGLRGAGGVIRGPVAPPPPEPPPPPKPPGPEGVEISRLTPRTPDGITPDFSKLAPRTAAALRQSGQQGTRVLPAEPLGRGAVLGESTGVGPRSTVGPRAPQAPGGTRPPVGPRPPGRPTTSPPPPGPSGSKPTAAPKPVEEAAPPASARPPGAPNATAGPATATPKPPARRPYLPTGRDHGAQEWAQQMRQLQRLAQKGFQ